MATRRLYGSQPNPFSREQQRLRREWRLFKEARETLKSVRDNSLPKGRTADALGRLGPLVHDAREAVVSGLLLLEVEEIIRSIEHQMASESAEDWRKTSPIARQAKKYLMFRWIPVTTRIHQMRMDWGLLDLEAQSHLNAASWRSRLGVRRHLAKERSHRRSTNRSR